MKKERVNEIFGVMLLFLGAFLLASLFFHHNEDHSFFSSHAGQPIKNLTGVAGVYISHYLILTLGFSSYFVPAAFFFLAGCLFLQKVPERKFFKFIGLGFFVISSTAIFTLLTPMDQKVNTGGLVGYLVANFLHAYFGQLGGLILSISCLLLSFLLATEFLLYPIFRNIWNWFYSGLQERVGEKNAREKEKRATSQLKKSEKKLEFSLKGLKERSQTAQSNKPPQISVKKGEKADIKQVEVRPFVFKDVPLKVKKYDPLALKSEVALKDDKKPVIKKNEIKEDKKLEKKAESLKEQEVKERQKDGLVAEAPKLKEKDGEVPPVPVTDVVSISISKSDINSSYRFPTLDLLNNPEPVTHKLEDDLAENSRILEQTLRDFGIDVKVVEVEQGPVITRYEILPAPGVKVSSITSLEDDLALALKATSVRIIAPIPGKAAVGIEIPNSTTNMVFIKDLLETREYANRKSKLPLVLGKDSSGRTLIADLTEMPHLLIAGTTGSGKTVCVNAIILGFLYSLSPADLKLVMIDPKMVELAVYNKIPHMISPVVTDVRKAAQCLNWVVGEMESRYRLLARVGVRNIHSFNTRSEDDRSRETNEIPAKLPYIVVIIDELADLMMVAQDKVEGAITRLAQLSRAVGIHIILATQRPSVDVITGVIKANFPARISFKVASKVDSRTVLDGNGADTLLGKGDMLFLEPGQPKPIRGQAALVKDNEINKVVKFVADQEKPQYLESLMQAGDPKQSGVSQEKDEMYDEAVRVVLQTGQASASILQRRLRLGYSRASRMIDQMEQNGIVGPFQGSKPREILVPRESFPGGVESSASENSEVTTS
ncbi:MAG: DNA translocase FtsK [Candidatus Omnitrophica bacterium]|nr:DNA translocase FtsK [Candidatus Omnitrophota bacterium]